MLLHPNQDCTHLCFDCSFLFDKVWTLLLVWRRSTKMGLGREWRNLLLKLHVA